MPLLLPTLSDSTPALRRGAIKGRGTSHLYDPSLPGLGQMMTGCHL